MREKGVGFTQRGLHLCGKSSFFERDFSEKNVPISPELSAPIASQTIPFQGVNVNDL